MSDTSVLHTFRRVAVYCGSSNHVAPKYFDAAEEMGRLLASRGIDVVFGGGSVGLMGCVADAALNAGGSVYGVIPEKLMDLELGHKGCTELIVVDNMHTRKAKMADLSDAFVALPGGYGTMEELFEMVTWGQLNYHKKPVGIVNIDGFYDPLLAWVARAAADGFVRDVHRNLIVSRDNPEALLSALQRTEVPNLASWIKDV